MQALFTMFDFLKPTMMTILFQGLYSKIPLTRVIKMNSLSGPLIIALKSLDLGNRK